MFSEQYFLNMLNLQTRSKCLKPFWMCLYSVHKLWCSVCWWIVKMSADSQMKKCHPLLQLLSTIIISLSLFLKNHFRLPFTFVTKEVAEATCNCLLAQAEQADKKGKSKAAAERMILEEFGRCLMSVINSAGKAKSDACAMNC